MELSESTYRRIAEYCDKGEAMYESGAFHKAISNYEKALDLLPNPKEDWEAATWICTALSDAYAELDENEESMSYLLMAEKSPGGTTNPYIQLQLGIAYYDRLDLNQARDYLLRAYMLEGDDIFEDLEAKYLSAIQDLI